MKPQRSTQRPQSTKPPGEEVVYVGMLADDAPELAALQRARVRATGLAPGQDLAARPGGAPWRLAGRDEAFAFARSLGLPTRQARAVAQALVGSRPRARDELAELAVLWAPAERGERVPPRLVLSGHSIGQGVYGDGNGTLLHSSLAALCRALPRAAAQIEDLHLSACSSATPGAAARFRRLFPNLKTFWAYGGVAPGPDTGAAQHLSTWEQATRGPAKVLDRALAAGTPGGENVITWSLEGGYQSGEAHRESRALRRELAGREVLLEAYFRGELEPTAEHRKPLEDYYALANRLLRKGENTPGEVVYLGTKRARASRLLHYSSHVAPRFAAKYAERIRAGYAAVGLAPPPDFGKLSRREALAAIAEWEVAARCAPGHDAVTALREPLLGGLRDLARRWVPNTWDASGH